MEAQLLMCGPKGRAGVVGTPHGGVLAAEDGGGAGARRLTKEANGRRRGS
jgi:hypothetical protein